jgi:hypothetical protein
LNDKNAQTICSQDIFSASIKEDSKLFLNSSISRIFPFLIALDSEIQIHNTLKLGIQLFTSSCEAKTQITVLILELHISIAAITFSINLFNTK